MIDFAGEAEPWYLEWNHNGSRTLLECEKEQKEEKMDKHMDLNYV